MTNPQPLESITTVPCYITSRATHTSSGDNAAPVDVNTLSIIKASVSGGAGRDGTYTYTPSEALQESGGFDQFTVTVRDRRFNPGGTGANALVISGNGGRAFVLNADDTISVFDTNRASATYNQIIGTIPVTTTVTDSGSGQIV